jgi:hypothetical protein
VGVWDKAGGAQPVQDAVLGRDAIFLGHAVSSHSLCRSLSSNPASCKLNTNEILCSRRCCQRSGHIVLPAGHGIVDEQCTVQGGSYSHESCDVMSSQMGSHIDALN